MCCMAWPTKSKTRSVERAGQSLQPRGLAAHRGCALRRRARGEGRAGDAGGTLSRRARGSCFASIRRARSRRIAALRWRGLSWYEYDPAWRVVGTIEPAARRTTFEISLAADGMLRCTRVGPRPLFRREERGGARRLLARGLRRRTVAAVRRRDQWRGDVWRRPLSVRHHQRRGPGCRATHDIVLDFNYAYNPSCAYDERWSCPLSPPENRLPFAVSAGERVAYPTSSCAAGRASA